MIEFFVTVMAFIAIGVVAWPLVRKMRGGNEPALVVEDTELGELLAQKDVALLALSELESDYEMRNLSEGDYVELKEKYEEQAIALLKSVDELRSERVIGAANDIDEEIEVLVTQMRGARDGRKIVSGSACPTCGAQVLPNTAFCSGCGTALGTRCYACSAAVNADDQFCFQCGAALNTIAAE